MSPPSTQPTGPEPSTLGTAGVPSAQPGGTASMAGTRPDRPPALDGAPAIDRPAPPDGPPARDVAAALDGAPAFDGAVALDRAPAPDGGPMRDGAAVLDGAVPDEHGLGWPDDDIAEPVWHPSELPPDLHVTAVVVAHNGARWLPEVIDALGAQTRPPERIIAVDTGSRDDSGAVLRSALGDDAVLTLDRSAGFGAAVAAAVVATAALPRPGAASEGRASEWLWLLHDDSAPAPDALANLLRTGTQSPSIGVVGPKVRGWTDERTLLEVGVTIARSGRRETGLERTEVDQGQHDDVGDVLAVGSAGMLVRRTVWDRLGGFDPRLPLFRDDVDFGWRVNDAGLRVVVAPAAVVRHVGAAASGRRTIEAGSTRRHLLDRRNALYVLLANLPARSLPWAYLRLILASVLRVVGFAIGKLPGAVIDEVAAVLGVLVRPDHVLAARRARRGTRTAPSGTTTALLAARGAQLARTLDAVSGVFSRGSHGSADIAAHGPRSVETGPAAEELQDLPPLTLRWLRAVVRPGPLLMIGLIVAALVAGRELLGAGRLMDGALFPAPDGARDLWLTYVGSWHDVGMGSDAVAPPYLAVVAFLASLLLGNAPLAVDVLLIGSVPLAGLSAWIATRDLARSPLLRAWAAGVYGLLPASTGAVAAGRLGTAVAIVVLPLVGSAVFSARTSWSAAWAAGLALAVAAAFVPLAYVLVVVVALVAWCALARTRGEWGRLVPVVVVPPLLLLPWSLEVVARPGLLGLEAGLPGPGLSDPNLPPAWLLLQSSGGPGSTPWWLGVPLVVGALAGLLRPRRRKAVLTGWLIAGVGLAAGVAVSFSSFASSGTATAVVGWPGLPVALVTAGLAIAAVVGAERVGERLAERSFGWRQPTTSALAVLIVAAPLLIAGWWVVRGSDDPLTRRDPVVLPEFVAAEGDDPTRPRTVVLRRQPDGSVSYALLRAAGPRLGDAETAPPGSAYGRLDSAIAGLVSGRAGQETDVLTDHAVQYVLMAAPVDEGLAGVLDAVPGLERVSTSDGEALWRLEEPAARLRLVGPDGAVLALLPAEREGARTEIPAGEPGRVAVLAEPADDAWLATVDGSAVESPQAGGWAQGFLLPPEGGELVVSYDSGERRAWLAAQAVLVGLVVVLAVPGARRESVGA